MNNLKERIADFFKEKIETRPSEQSSTRKEFSGFFEALRAETFQSGNFSPSPKKGTPWSELSGEIYRIASLGPSVVVAVYQDDAILWLDDHSDDSDFKEFIQREVLSAWLPDRMDQMVEVLVETKLNYVGFPKLIHSASDIPTITEKQEVFHVTESKLEDERKQLADIANQVRSPLCVRDKNGEFQLQFCIWTSIYGRVIEIRCYFGADYVFRYEGTLLTHSIGRWTLFR